MLVFSLAGYHIALLDVVIFAKSAQLPLHYRLNRFCQSSIGPHRLNVIINMGKNYGILKFNL